MTTLKTSDAFTNSAFVGCSMSWAVDGFELVARLVEDDLADPYKYGWFDDDEVIAAWKRDEWCFVGIKVDVYRAGVLLVENGANLWGLAAYGDCGAYLTATAKELGDDALVEAKENLAKLIASI